MQKEQIYLAGFLATIAGAMVYVGCSSDSTTDGGTDSGTSDTSTGTDTGTSTDSGKDAGTIAVTCDDYCKHIVTACVGGNLQYIDEATCKLMCAKIPLGDGGATAGNSLNCRVYHLTVASSSAANADTHCPHAGPFGYGGCGDECEDFCTLYGAQCGGANFSDAGCTASCPTLTNVDGGFMEVTGGNSLDCREYHLENAYKVGDTNGQGHCGHSNLSGKGGCE